MKLTTVHTGLKQKLRIKSKSDGGRDSAIFCSKENGISQVQRI